MHGVFM
jgi:hypothetical protein